MPTCQRGDAFFQNYYFHRSRILGHWLNTDTTKLKSLGQPIQFWDNIDSVKGRKPYPKLREYIFVSLIARTDIDLIALDKGELSERKAVDMLMQTMEEYANFGFHLIEDKLIDDANCFYSEMAFLEMFLSFETTHLETQTEEEDEPESLD